MGLWREADDDETEEIIEKIAQTVVVKEMDIPALFFLGALRPVAYIGGQMSRFFLAGVAPLLGDMRYEYISVLEQPDNVKKIMSRIDELREENAERKELERKERKEDPSEKKRNWYQIFG